MVTTKLDARPRIVNPTTLLDTQQSPAGAEASSAGDTKQKASPAPEQPSLTGAAALIETIREAAVREHVDPVKFDRLLKAQERIADQEARVAFDRDFARMQSELPVIERRGSISDEFGAPGPNYARWEDINEAIKPVLTQFGFGLRFRTSQDHGAVVVAAVLTHSQGHSEETTIRLPVDLTGGKNAVQAIGSSTSYGKRYAASAILNLTSRDEDDDGTSAIPTPKITREELAELRRLVASAKANEGRLASYFGVLSLEDLPPSELGRAREAVQVRGERP